MRSSSNGAPRLCAVAYREASDLALRSDSIGKARALGFDGVLLPSRTLLGSWNDASGPDAGAWRDLGETTAALCAGGLDLFLDLDLITLPTEHPLVQRHPEVFAVRAGPGDGGSLDPRVSARADGSARLRSDAGPGGEAWATWAEEMLGRAVAAGAGGLFLRSVTGASPRTWADLLARVRETGAAVTFIADTAGEDRASALRLAGCGFDNLASSLAWWDGRAPWLLEEYEALRVVAPLVADLSGLEGRALVQALSLAPALVSGLIASLPTGDDAESLVAGEALREANRLLSDLCAFDGELQSMTRFGAPVTALLRAAGPDLRTAEAALLLLANRASDRETPLSSGAVLGGAAAGFTGYQRMQGGGDPFTPLAPGEVRLLKAVRAKPILFRAKPGRQAARAAAEAPRIAIEALSPCVDAGRFPVKRTVGDAVVVEADVFADGHEQLAVELLWRPVDTEAWSAAPMAALGNDRWRARFTPDRLGRHLFAVEAWLDLFGGFRRDFRKKLDAGVAQPVDRSEGLRLVEAARDRSEGELRTALDAAAAQIEGAGQDVQAERLLSDDLAVLMSRADARPFMVRSPPQALEAERLGARFASWYELFPRSQTDDPARHGTFDDVIAELPRVRAMGFDVLYFPPIHPIGRRNRKGRNNSLTAAPDDPGSPYAIGAEEGGHDAVHPDLGGLEAFDRLVAAARGHGLEIALDFAVQCAPDHPWLKQHPGWFDYRPDGSIKYAENPPKKYEDIVNVDFYKPDAVPALWLALRDAVLFWAERGVRLFRVDNPHTKPLPFWEWMIADVRGRYPDAVFLAEAFTRPKLMYRLAKIGFSQSYTYFTWRNSKAEFIAYLTELTTTAPREFFRPHFFVNTPDINPYFLQTSGRAGFLIRAALAATLSGLFGVYSGFELLEADPVPGKEEYKDSEKYEIRPRDWARPGNITAEITRLNAIRRAEPTLQTHLGVRFYSASNDQVLYFGKAAADADGAVQGEMVLTAISLDPHRAQSFDFEVPLWEWGLPDDGTVEVEDLLHGHRFDWQGKVQHLTLTPDQPYAIWRIAPAGQR